MDGQHGAATRIVIADGSAETFGVPRVLRDHGFFVDGATDGQEALSLIEAQRPTVAVLSERLATLDGVSVCREVRRRNVPVRLIVATRNVERALRAGADDVLPESYTGGDLLERLHVATFRYRTTGLQLQRALESAAGRSGEIVISAPQGGARVLVSRGEVAWVRMMGAPSVAHELIQQGLIGRAELRAILEECRRVSGNVISLMLEWQLVPEEQLVSLLSRHFAALLARVDALRGASVVFLEGPPSPGAPTFSLSELACWTRRFTTYPAPSPGRLEAPEHYVSLCDLPAWRGTLVCGEADGQPLAVLGDVEDSGVAHRLLRTMVETPSMNELIASSRSGQVVAVRAGGRIIVVLAGTAASPGWIRHRLRLFEHAPAEQRSHRPDPSAAPASPGLRVKTELRGVRMPAAASSPSRRRRIPPTSESVSVSAFRAN